MLPKRKEFGCAHLEMIVLVLKTHYMLKDLQCFITRNIFTMRCEHVRQFRFKNHRIQKLRLKLSPFQEYRICVSNISQF